LFPQIVSAQVKMIQKGLTLSPLRSELNINPGTSLDGQLTVTNSTSKAMVVNINAEEFSVINQQYDYAFTTESDVSKWARFNPSEVNIPSGESKKVTYTIGVPLSSEPGGRYISLFASTNTGLLNGGVESKQRIASLVYITVLGDVTRAGNLVSLTSPWLITGDNNWNVAIQNTGSTHFRSRYNVQVKDLLWDGVAASESGESLILPGTIRSVSDKLPAPKWPGIYKVVYNIGLGDTPAKIETRVLIYMPIWTTFSIITIATVLLYWFYSRRKK